MKIYHISQNIFKAKVYPGDPIPTKNFIKSIDKGDSYTLSTFSMSSHTGTHVDAPSHFIKDGKTIEEISLNKFVGYCYVFEIDEPLTKEIVNNIFNKINELNINKILIKGKGILTLEGAKAIEDMNIDLIGTELLSFGNDLDEEEIHKILLKSNIVLLEGINLENINTGKYFLNSAPLKLDELEGAPCRAILIKGI